MGVALVALASAPTVFRAMFSGFQDYDDEGYLLMVLREYARGGRLYDEVYSQYGPAYHQLVAGVFRLAGLGFTHVHGRAVVLVLWLAAAATIAVLTYRLTGSAAIAWCAQVVASQTLVPLRDEPLHPGGLLVFLVAGAVLAGSWAPTPGWQGRLAGGLAGALLGLALLTKINVGGFAVVSMVFAFLSAGPAASVPAAGRLLATTAFVLVPIALLGPASAHPDVRAHLVVVVVATVGIVLVDRRRTHLVDDVTRRGLGPVAAALVATLVLSGSWERWRGTGWRGLADGIVLGPARHPAGFLEPPALGTWPIAYAGLWLAMASLAALAGNRALAGLRGPGALGGPLRIAVGAGIWLVASGAPPLSLLAVAPPALWLALAAPPGGSGPGFGRRLLVATAALQALHPFPVGGSQVAFGTVFVVPVAALLVADGWRATAATLGGVPGVGPGRVRLVKWGLGALMVLGALSGAALTARRFALQYEAGVPLGLPGAERVRVPAEQAALYRRLTTSLRANCATFISQPGFNSLYFFAGLEPPTRMNATAWMVLFDDARQTAIVERLSGLPGPLCAIRRQRASRPWRTPLALFIDERFVTMYRQDYFEFRVSRAGGAPATTGAAGPGGGMQP